ncbi:MAG: hypothetical protein M1445_00820, partial [Bacteroidetes bacterium]|nr:hypothetical protein [Bacteroidota bacterium]
YHFKRLVFYLGRKIRSILKPGDDHFNEAPLALGLDWRPVFVIVDNTAFMDNFKTQDAFSKKQRHVSNLKDFIRKF